MLWLLILPWITAGAIADPAVIALIGTIFGGVGLKVMEHFLSKGKIRIDEATQLRSELRLEIEALREEVRQLEAAVDKWREEYYNVRDQLIAKQTELTIALQALEHKH